MERLIERSGLGWTTLRTTQFHDLVLMLLAAAARSPVMPIPAGVKVQPVDVREVADRLAELAGGEPRGRVPDLGGPRVETFRDLARAYLRATGKRRLLLPVCCRGVRSPAIAAAATSHPTTPTASGFEEFLAEHSGRSEYEGQGERG